MAEYEKTFKETFSFCGHDSADYSAFKPHTFRLPFASPATMATSEHTTFFTNLNSQAHLIQYVIFVHLKSKGEVSVRLDLQLL